MSGNSEKAESNQPIKKKDEVTLKGSSNDNIKVENKDTVVLSGNSNDNIIIQNCNNVTVSGDSNKPVYLVNCSNVEISGNINHITLVDSNLTSSTGRSNDISHLTVEEFDKIKDTIFD